MDLIHQPLTCPGEAIISMVNINQTPSSWWLISNATCCDISNDKHKDDPFTNHLNLAWPRWLLGCRILNWKWSTLRQRSFLRSSSPALLARLAHHHHWGLGGSPTLEPLVAFTAFTHRIFKVIASSKNSRSELERSTMRFMGKSTIELWSFSEAFCKFTRGKCWSTFLWFHWDILRCYPKKLRIQGKNTLVSSTGNGKSQKLGPPKSEWAQNQYTSPWGSSNPIAKLCKVA